MKKVFCIILLLLFVLCSCNTAQADTTSVLTETFPVTTDTSYVTDTTSGEITASGKKYFTMSFDDGITQDQKFIKFLQKYNLYNCTFNINTGLLGKTEHITVYDYPVNHSTFAESTIKNGVYSGYEVAVHGLNHPMLDKCTDSEVITEIGTDAENILALTGTAPVGMAYPNGNYYTDHTIDVILNNTDIRYARTVTSTYTFDLPKRFMEWNPTIQASDKRLLELAQSFIDAKVPNGEVMLFYVWGHAFEFDTDHYTNWRTLDSFLQLISGRDDIEYVTNVQFYELYKDKIPS